MELAKHLDAYCQYRSKIYFRVPQSPWQWGTDENTSGLIRQFPPKRHALPKITSRSWIDCNPTKKQTEKDLEI